MAEMRQRCHPLELNISVPVPGLSIKNSTVFIPTDCAYTRGLWSSKGQLCLGNEDWLDVQVDNDTSNRLPCSATRKTTLSIVAVHSGVQVVGTGLRKREERRDSRAMASHVR
jgi:hypothetical protein